MKICFKVAEKRLVFLLISLFAVLVALSFVIFKGFNLGIDFESGLSMTVVVSSDAATIDEIRNTTGCRVIQVGDNSEHAFQIRCTLSDNEERKTQETKIRDLLNDRFGSDNISIRETNFIGAKFSMQLITGSAKAVAIALVLILCYVWMRFRAAYAICSIVALVHDVICMFGFISLANLEITGTTIAAILTIIGYSLNNTIVIFDRIREEIKVDNHRKMNDLINSGVNDCLTRTTFSSITTLLAVIPLAVFAKADVYAFALCMIEGIIVGTWSSNFTATALLYMLGSTDALDIRRPKKDDDLKLDGNSFKVMV